MGGTVGTGKFTLKVGAIYVNAVHVGSSYFIKDGGGTGYGDSLSVIVDLVKGDEVRCVAEHVTGVNIVTGKQIGRASCRERVCLYV